MKLNFLENLALYVVKVQPSSVLPNIAMQGLVDGYESPSLLLLAGLATDENPFVIDEYFKKVLQELNVDLVGTNQAAFFLVKSIAKKILDNQIDTYAGCDFIFSQILSSTDLRRQDDKFVYDSIGLSDIYSLYITIEELKNASIRWDKLKTNEQLIEEAKENIKMKFKEWNNDSLIAS